MVKKFAQEKLGKEEKRLQRDAAIESKEETEVEAPDDAGLDLLFRDESNEQAVIRALIEFGSRVWDESRTVAEYIFEEVDRDGLEELFDNKLLISILQDFRSLYHQGTNPTEKNFLYHQDPQICQMAVSLLTEKHEISPNWSKYFKGDIQVRDQRYKEEVLSCMTYLKLKKVKRLIIENQLDLEKDQTSEDMIILLQTHRHLKQLEMDLMKSVGTVIYK